MKFVGIIVLAIVLVSGVPTKAESLADSVPLTIGTDSSCNVVTQACARVEVLHTGTQDLGSGDWISITFHVHGEHTGASIEGRASNSWGAEDSCGDGSDYCATHADVDRGEITDHTCWTGRAISESFVFMFNVPGAVAQAEDCY